MRKSKDKEKRKHICRECGEEFEYDEALYECKPDLCPNCTQERIRDSYGYEGGMI